MKVTQSCLTLCDPMDYRVHGILQARILEWVAVPFSRESSQPRSPALQVGSWPAEPPGKSNNTGVGNLSLLQQIFPTQESNWGLLHCKQILYQLNYQGSPKIWESRPNAADDTSVPSWTKELDTGLGPKVEESNSQDNKERRCLLVRCIPCHRVRSFR